MQPVRLHIDVEPSPQASHLGCEYCAIWSGAKRANLIISHISSFGDVTRRDPGPPRIGSRRLRERNGRARSTGYAPPRALGVRMTEPTISAATCAAAMVLRSPSATSWRVHPSAGRRHDTLRRHGRRARPQYPAVCRCPYAHAARACQPDLHPGRLPLDDQGRSLPRLTSRRRCARLWRSILVPSAPDPVNPKPAGHSLSRRGLQQRRSGAKPNERRDRATAWVVRGQSP